MNRAAKIPLPTAPAGNVASVRPRAARGAGLSGWFVGRVKRLVRVGFYACVVLGILAVLGARSALGNAKVAVVAFGDELLRMAENGSTGGGYAIRVNGQVLKVSTAQTRDSVKAVLDRFEKSCAHHADGLADEFAHLQAAMAAPAAARGFPGVGAMREDKGDRGVVACFATGEPGSVKGTIDRALAFAESHDLSAFGEFRYVVARKNAAGGSFVVASWTEGKIDLDEMFPAAGDAPGLDLADVPRPHEGRRMLSAEIEGSKYRIRAYQVRQGQEEILSRYDREMTRRGWRPALPDPALTEVSHTRAYSKNGVDLFITMGGSSDMSSANGGESILSVVEMAN
jgi:hypothetical protein